MGPRLRGDDSGKSLLHICFAGMTVRRIVLRPAREAQAGACSSRRSVAGHIFEPVEIEVLDRASDRYPVQDLRRSGMQLVTRQRLEELRILVGAGLEDRAIEILIDQEVAQSARGKHA